MNSTESAAASVKDAQADARADTSAIQEPVSDINTPERTETRHRDGDGWERLATRLDSIDRKIDRIAARSEPAELLDARDSAGLLGLARSTFLSRVSTGEIAPVPIRIGGRVSWRRSELIAWLDSGCPARAIWAARRQASKESAKS